MPEAARRYKKEVQPVAPMLFGVLGTPPVVVPPVLPLQEAEFQEWTGRLGFDWQVDTPYGESMLYGFYSRGYKGGGFNPPGSVGIAGITETFDPEFVNSFEIGLKNTLFDGRMLLNITGFYYDYEGYQISRIVNRSSVNENIDTTVQGIELEGIWEPIDGLRLNGTLGWLETEIQGGASLDVFNRAQGAPGWTLIHDPITAQNCLAPTSFFDAMTVGILDGLSPLVLGLFGLGNACSTTGSGIGLTANPLAPAAVRTIEGFEVDLTGKELPNSPHWTANFGAEYNWALGGGWEATARADYYWQGDSYARIFNSDADRIEGYDNLNLLLRINRPDSGFTFELWGQNVTDETAITDAYLTDDSSGLFRNIFLTEPRTFGMRVSQEW